MRPLRPRVALVLSLLVLGAGVGAAALRIGLLKSAGGVRLGATWALTDFYSAAYYPVRAVLAGGTPYTLDHTYPPYAPLHLLLHLPFALLPPGPAGVAYFASTVLLTCLLALLALRLTRIEPAPHRVLLLAGAVLLSRPGHWTLLLGQVSVLLTVASYVALGGPPSRPWAGPVAIAVTLLKPTYGLPLALMLWAWGQRRSVLRGLGLAALVNLPMLALYAAREGSWRELLAAATGGYRSWQDIVDVNPATSSTRSDLTSLVSRFLGAPLSDAGQIVLAIAVLAAAAAALRRLRPGAGAAHDTVAVGIVCLAMALVGFHRAYDLVLLTAPCLALAAAAPSSALPLSPGLRRLLLVLYAVPALNWIATESVLRAWQPSRAAWLLVTSANALCLVGLLVAYLRMAVRLAPIGVGQAGAPLEVGPAKAGQ